MGVADGSRMGVLGEPCPFSGVNQQCIPHTYMARGSGLGVKLWVKSSLNSAVRVNNKYKLDARRHARKSHMMREYDEVGWLGERATQR